MPLEVNSMNVKELIKELQKFPQNAEVKYWDSIENSGIKHVDFNGVTVILE